MDNVKLTWDEICNRFDREWVQLVDYDWAEDESLPKAGVVQNHAKSRREFDELIIMNPQPESALLFVGKRDVQPGVVLSANHHQWKPASG
jgi:hypothetical protein